MINLVEETETGRFYSTLTQKADEYDEMKLSSSEIRQYNEDGYLIPKLSLSELKLNELKQAVERVLVANRGIRPEHLISVHIDRLNDEGVRGDQTFFELASNPLILDCVEQVMGPDIILCGCQLFCKPGSY